MTDKSNKDDSWSKEINAVFNLMLITALIAIIFGFFATFGALFALRVF